MKKNDQAVNTRQRRLNIRLSPSEWDKIHKFASNTTCRSVSEYARKVLAAQPVKVFYRNKSFDEFEERIVGLLTQLDHFGDNFEQAVKKLSNPGSPPEMTATLSHLLTWGKTYAATVELIRGHIEKLSDQCDPK